MKQGRVQVTEDELSSRAQQVHTTVGSNGEIKLLQTTATYEPLRIVLDETYFSNDPGRNCLGGAGSQYWRGSSPVGTNPCASPSQTECLATCTSEEALTQDKLNWLKTEVFPKAIEQLGKMLKVVRGADPLRVPQAAYNQFTSTYGECGNMVVPSSIVTTGVAGADIVLYLSTRPTQGSTIAYASSCITNSIGRPIVGFVNWGSNSIKSTCDASELQAGTCSNEKLLAKAIGVAAHEITHALGFSSSMFKSYAGGTSASTPTPTAAATPTPTATPTAAATPTPTAAATPTPTAAPTSTPAPAGNTSTNASAQAIHTQQQQQQQQHRLRTMAVDPSVAHVLREKTLTEGVMTHTITEVYTPTVVQVAKEHFNCPEVTGVALEDQGGSGTGGSHWEKIMLWDEYMTGTASLTPYFSRFTAALLQDSGWYQADFTQTQTLKYGYQEGCSFANAPRCSAWTQSNGHTGYFCNDEMANSCSYDRSARAGCAIRQWSSIPPWKQHLSDPTLGGIEELADYCPMFVPYTNGDCTVEANLRTSGLGEQYAYDSLCFESTLANNTVAKAASSQFFGCYRSKCADSKTLKVKVGLIWYDCPAEGGPLSNLDGFHGQIVCPKPGLHCADVTKRIRWPAVLDIFPAQGITEGGTTVTLEGQYFSSYPRVWLGDAKCLDIEVERSGRSSRLSCIAGKYSIKTAGVSEELVSVVVVDSRGQSGAQLGGFLYRNVGQASSVRLNWMHLVLLVLVTMVLQMPI